ncbi:hypothetical protein NPIL_254911 [Nephila pilipes]|uniref:Uncharacterized protein n=1 Tax=Nephila pilipes TaxID=299642 RepID=A0A8X6TH27_NEPPI|nr:hypothetical protein NPIL_254911 [Nephila pilipes]
MRTSPTNISHIIISLHRPTCYYSCRNRQRVASFHPSSRIFDPNYEPFTAHIAHDPMYEALERSKGTQQYQIGKERVLDPEPISRSSPPKEASIHIDLRIEKALQNLSCSDPSEKDNASEFDWKKYMLSEHEGIKSDELESNSDALRARDETFRIRNGPERMSFVDTNTEDTNSSDI